MEGGGRREEEGGGKREGDGKREGGRRGRRGRQEGGREEREEREREQHGHQHQRCRRLEASPVNPFGTCRLHNPTKTAEVDEDVMLWRMMRGGTALVQT